MKNKIFALLLAVLLLMNMIACNQNATDTPDDKTPENENPGDTPGTDKPEDPQDKPDEKPEDPAPNVIDVVVDGMSDYTVVYDDSDPMIAEQAKAFVKRLDHKYFIDVVAVGASEAEEDYGHEIIIGDARKNAKAVSSLLKGGDFAIGVVEDDWVFCASNPRLYTYLFDILASKFLSKYKDGNLSVSEEDTFVYHDSEFATVNYVEYLKKKGNVTSDTIETIFEYRSFTAEDGTTLPYRLYVPYEYDPAKEYPVLIVLHGAGQRGTDNLGGVKYMVPQILNHENSPATEAIIICPQCPEHPNQWVDTPWGNGNYSVDKVKMSNELGAVLELLYAIEEEFSTDSDRYYVTGLSMGGFGTWDLLMRYPELFAAGVPVCGGADPSYAEVLKDVPIYTVHSTDDPTVPVFSTQAMVEALREAGNWKIVYKELEGYGHGVWNWTSEQASIWEWLFSQNLSFR